MRGNLAKPALTIPSGSGTSNHHRIFSGIQAPTERLAAANVVAAFERARRDLAGRATNCRHCFTLHSRSILRCTSAIAGCAEFVASANSAHLTQRPYTGNRSLLHSPTRIGVSSRRRVDAGPPSSQSDDASRVRYRPNQKRIEIGSKFRGPMGTLAQGSGTRNGFAGSGEASRLASMKIGKPGARRRTFQIWITINAILVSALAGNG
jgi:hypothetical protein